MLVWCDLETTGLDPFADRICEVGLIVTTDDLVELGRWSAVLHVDRAALEGVDPDVDDMHHASGLWAECAASQRLFGAAMREARTWLKCLFEAHPGHTWHLAGSSVWFDRGFVASWAPELLEGLHHRILDVSALRLAAETWGLPPLERGPVAHRAIPDIEASIAELRHWRMEFCPRSPAFPDVCDAVTGGGHCENPPHRMDQADVPGLCAAHLELHAASALLRRAEEDRLLLAKVRGLLVEPRDPAAVEEVRRLEGELARLRSIASAEIERRCEAAVRDLLAGIP